MGQAAKYALLAAGLLIVVGLVISFVAVLNVTEVGGEASTAIASFASSCAPYIQFGRGFVNWLVGSSELVSLFLTIIFLAPVTKFGISLTVTVYKWLNQ